MSCDWKYRIAGLSRPRMPQTVSLERQYYWKDSITGKTVSLERQYHWKDSSTGKTVALERQ